MMLKTLNSFNNLNTIVIANWGMGLAIVKSLHAQQVTIKHIYTQYVPDSQDQWENCVYDFAQEHNYPVTPLEKISFDKMVSLIEQENIELMIVHALMKKVPESIYSIASLHCVNIHASLLPKYRGPSPNYWVLHNKEKITGVTAHYIDSDFDEGAIIEQITVPINENDDMTSLIEKEKHSIPRLMAEVLHNISDDNFMPIKQDHSQASYAPRV